MYVAGFVLAVRTDRKDDYFEVARTAGAVFREHGATRVVECWGDDVAEGTLTSFPKAVDLKSDETTVFSWLEFPDKATYESCMKAVEADPRMQVPHSSDISDPARMIYGAFVPVLDF